MKQFFNYHSKISSLELSQAFATITAPGPFIGFANGFWRTDKDTGDPALEVYSEPDKDDAFALILNQYTDQRYRRYIANRYDEDSGGYPTFGCITKDGTIYTSNEEKITLPIQKRQESSDGNSANEVFLFAVHSPIEEDIKNPVTFVAYWNEGNALYPLCKKSVDAYYKQRAGDVTDPLLDSDLTFSNLDQKVKAACTAYSTNYDTYTLIGIYGRGTNVDTGDTDDFSLVTYFSQFPMTLSYNTAIHSALVKSLSTINSLQKRLLGEIGEIHMFAGTNIPDGYLVCDGQNYSKTLYPELYAVIGDTYNKTISHNDDYYTTDPGDFRVPDLRSRFVVGRDQDITEYQTLGKGGGKKEVALVPNQLPSHHHTVDQLFFAEHHSSIGNKQGRAAGFYGLTNGVLTKGQQGTVTEGTEEGYPGLHGTTTDTDNDTLPYVTIDSGDLGGNVAHENRPPYYVMTYIIRAKI